MNPEMEKEVSKCMTLIIVLLTIIGIGIMLIGISQVISLIMWLSGMTIFIVGMPTERPYWMNPRPPMETSEFGEGTSFPLPGETEFSGGALGVNVSGSFNYESNFRMMWEAYKAQQQRAGKEYVGYSQFLGVVRRAEASEYTADAARNAKEYSALMSYQGQVVQNTGKIVAAQLGLKGKEATAFASQYVSEQNRAAKEMAAEMGYRGQVDTASIDKEAKIAAAELGLRGQQAQAYAEQYKADQARLAQMYSSQLEKQAKYRAAQAQEYQARRGEEGQIGSSVATASGEVVSKGFASLMYSSNKAYDYAYQGTTKREVATRFAMGMAIFVIGTMVVLVAMEIAGFPILEQLTNIVAVSVGKAVGMIQSMTALADNGNISGLQKIIADGGASLAGAGSSLFALMLKRLQDVFSQLWVWFQSLWTGLTNAVSGTQGAATGITDVIVKNIILPIKTLFRIN